MIPHYIYDFLVTNNCVFFFNDFKPHTGPAKCEEYMGKLEALLEGFNFYDLYQPASMNPTAETESREGVTWVGGEQRTYKRGMTQKEYTPFVRHFKDGYEGLTTAHKLSDYVNSNATRKALNIPDEVPVWNMCWDNSEFTYHLQQEDSTWIYPILRGAGIR